MPKMVPKLFIFGLKWFWTHPDTFPMEIPNFSKNRISFLAHFGPKIGWGPDLTMGATGRKKSIFEKSLENL